MCDRQTRNIIHADHALERAEPDDIRISLLLLLLLRHQSLEIRFAIVFGEVDTGLFAGGTVSEGVVIVFDFLSRRRWRCSLALCWTLLLDCRAAASGGPGSRGHDVEIVENT